MCPLRKLRTSQAGFLVAASAACNGVRLSLNGNALARDSGSAHSLTIERPRGHSRWALLLER